MNVKMMNKAAAKLAEAKEMLELATKALGLGDAYEQKRWEAQGHCYRAIKLLAECDAYRTCATDPYLNG